MQSIRFVYKRRGKNLRGRAQLLFRNKNHVRVDHAILCETFQLVFATSKIRKSIF